MSTEEQRASGDFVPFVLQAVSGAFTANGTNEKLYVIQIGECYAPHSEGWGLASLPFFGAAPRSVVSRWAQSI
jgi:hypothetical protein